MFRLLALACLACLPLCAEETPPLAIWDAGAGSINQQPVRVGAVIAAGQEIHCAPDSLLRLQLAGSPGSTLTLGADARVSLRLDPLPDGRSDLVVEVHAGAVEVDLAPVRPWRELRVDGSSMQVHVTGTLFLFERRKQGQDYLAMVRGKVKVNLIAALVGGAGNQTIDVEAGRSLTAGAGGLGPVGSVAGTPQLPISAGAPVVGGTGGTGGFTTAFVSDTVDSGVHDTTNDTTKDVVQSVTDGGVSVLPGPPGTP